MIIVHDVVVKQREVVDQFHSGRPSEGHLDIGPHRLRRKQSECRSKRFARTVVGRCSGAIDPTPVILDDPTKFRLESGTGRRQYRAV